MQTQLDARENNLDFIRFVLAFVVIFSHSYPLGLGTARDEPIVLLSRGRITAGGIAVFLFFIISGFLITASYERSRTLFQYLKKRILRIYPGFIVAMLFGLLVVLPISGGHLVEISTAARLKSLLAQTAHLYEFNYNYAFADNPTPGAINGSIWSIQYEFWCYLAVAVLGLCGLLRSKLLLSVLFILSLAVSSRYAIHPAPRFQTMTFFGFTPFWFQLLPLYLAGVLAYRLRGHMRLGPAWLGTGCGLMVAVFLLPFGWSALFPIVGAYLVLAFAFHPAIRLHRWARFGDFSYGVYLYGYPIQQMIMHRIGHTIPAWKLFVLAAPVTLVCAILSWYGVERWFVQPTRWSVSMFQERESARRQGLTSNPT